MNQNEWSTVKIRCPFFHKEDGRSIVCEGMIPGTLTIVRFRAEKREELHVHTYCQRDYERCYLCRALTKKYDEKAPER